MTALSDLGKYAFETTKETNYKGETTREPVKLELRRMSVREREEVYGAYLTTLFSLSQAYAEMRTMDSLRTLHSDLTDLVQALASETVVQEVRSWIGRVFGPSNILRLVHTILREEGLLPPLESIDLPSEIAVDKMPEDKLESLGED